MMHQQTQHSNCGKEAGRWVGRQAST